MGFFGRIFGGATSETTPAVKGWPERIASYSDLDIDQQAALHSELLTPIGTQLGEGTFHHAPNDNRGEWRTSLAGHPMRLTLDSASQMEGVLKAPNAHGEVILYWDPEIVETPHEGAWGDDDIVRIFVGEKVFFKQPAWTLHQHLNAYQSLPATVLQPLIDAMARHRIYRLGIDESEICWSGYDRFETLSNPLAPECIGSVANWCQLVGQAASQFASTPGRPESQPEISLGKEHVHTCQYCHAKFLLARGKCTNCGAPAN